MWALVFSYDYQDCSLNGFERFSIQTFKSEEAATNAFKEHIRKYLLDLAEEDDSLVMNETVINEATEKAYRKELFQHNEFCETDYTMMALVALDPSESYFG